MKTARAWTVGSAAALAVAAALALGPGTNPPVRAQDNSQATATAQNMSDMEIVKAAINAERTDLLANYLGLTDAEASAFWPLYKQYRDELNKVSDDQVKLVGSYLQSRDTLSDDEARKITEDLLGDRKKKVDIQKGYVGKFGKVLPGKKVARLYQLENKVDAVLAYEAADRIPLVPVNAAAPAGGTP
jgi:hypothetical protein